MDPPCARMVKEQSKLARHAPAIIGIGLPTIADSRIRALEVQASKLAVLSALLPTNVAATTAIADARRQSECLAVVGVSEVVGIVDRS